MKTLYNLWYIVLCFFLFTSQVLSQNCEQFNLLKQGTSYTMKNYDAKDKMTSTSRSTVKNVSNKAGLIEALISSEITDHKNKPAGNGEVSISCEKNILYMDLRSMLNQESMKGFENMEIKIENSMMEIPLNAKEGQQFSDGYMTIRISSEGISIATIELKITNRKVVALEKMTTEAGTFDTYKMTYDMETIMSTIFPIRTMASIVEWYSPNNGTIRSESYNKNGKLSGYSQLTELIH